MQRTFIRLAAVLAVAAFVAGLSLVANGPAATRAANGETTWNITVQNLTEGQPFSPPVVVVHDATADVLEVGSAASAGVQAIAEDGNPAPLVAALEGAGGIHDVTVFGGPILAGTSATVMVSGPSGSLVSIVGMLICTNDGFTGADSWALPVSGSSSLMANAYDAGTEMNTEAGPDIIDACQAAGPVSLPDDGNARPAESGVITMHAGITGSGVLTTDDHGWTDPVATITAQQVPTVSYTVAIDNLTTGQPLTPPVIAAHSASGEIFSAGEAASMELREVAENGNNAPLLASLDASPFVYNAEMLGAGPILPGTRLTATFEAPEGSLISLVAMLICTNDGFTGLASVSLGTGIDMMTMAYDAGSEGNTEAAADLVPPCGAIGPVAFTGGGGKSSVENGGITMHAGITGGGVLTAAHDWDGPVARIQVTSGAAEPPPATPTATIPAPTPTATQPAPTATATEPAPTTPAPGAPDTGSGIESSGSHSPALPLLAGAVLVALGGATFVALRRTVR